jgi:hypothetical protein
MDEADGGPHAAYVAQMRAYIAELKAHDVAQRASREASRMRRARARKVAAPGEHHAETDGRAKITEDDVRSIRRRHAAGENRNDLAKECGISCRSVNLIVSRRRWAHFEA